MALLLLPLLLLLLLLLLILPPPFPFAVSSQNEMRVDNLRHPFALILDTC